MINSPSTYNCLYAVRFVNKLVIYQWQMVLIFTECGIKKVLFLDLPELYKPCSNLVDAFIMWLPMN